MAPQAVPLTITKLFNAVKKGELDVIANSLALYGIPKCGPKTTDYLILQTALEKGQREIAKLLINAGCRLKAIPSDSELTPLAHTFIQEDEEIALMILTRGTTVYVDNTMRSTVLHLAAERKSLKMLRFIFISSIDVNFLDSDGKTALQILLETYTVHKSNIEVKEVEKLEMIRLLLSKGASVDFRSSYGKTALHYVASLKQKDIITFVLKRTVNVNLCDNQQRTALHYLLNSDYKSENSIYEMVELFIAKGARIDIVDFLNMTVAHIAAGKKHFKILNKFLECQCNVSLQDYNGNTVLHRLLENSSRLSGKEDIMNFVNLIMSMASLENVQNSSGKTPLQLAAENHHYKVVEKMLPRFKNVNVTDCENETMLHIMLRNFSDAYFNIIIYLLNAGANVDMKNKHSIAPIHLASKTGNKNLLLLMLQQSKNLTQYYYQHQSILHYLSELKIDSENEKLQVAQIAKKCVEQGVQIDGLNELRRTPLLVAALNQNKFMMEFLFKVGANPNYTTNDGTIIEQLMGKSSFSNADLEIAELLVCNGAGTYSTVNGLLSLFKLTDSHEKRLFLHKLLNKCNSLNIFDLSGNTILHHFLNPDVNTVDADETDMIKMIQIFVDKQVSVNAKNNKGITALHLAAKNKYALIAEFLLKKGANVTCVDNKGNSVLHFVCVCKVEIDANVENNMIDLFIENGCKVDAINIFNETPLFIATQCGSINMVKALIANGADIKCGGGENLSHAIHLAAELNYTTIIEYLLECGASVYDKRKGGKTALHVAAVHGNLEASRLLLKEWTDPDVRDDNGRTALHWACWHGNLEIVRELIMWGADVNAVDKRKVTPLMLSQDSNNVVWTELQTYIALLLAAGLDVAWQSIACINNYKKRVNTQSLNAHAQAEVQKMQQIQIDNVKTTTLADVLKMKFEKLNVFINNSDFKKLITSEFFQTNFPFYSPIIKSFYARATLRNHLSMDATNVLRRVSRLALPDDCTEEILKYLKNEHLINLIQAVQLKDIKKRKRSNSGLEECNPSKRVQPTNE